MLKTVHAYAYYAIIECWYESKDIPLEKHPCTYPYTCRLPWNNSQFSETNGRTTGKITASYKVVTAKVMHTSITRLTIWGLLEHVSNILQLHDNNSKLKLAHKYIFSTCVKHENEAMVYNVFQYRYLSIIIVRITHKAVLLRSMGSNSIEQYRIHPLASLQCNTEITIRGMLTPI